MDRGNMARRSAVLVIGFVFLLVSSMSPGEPNSSRTTASTAPISGQIVLDSDQAIADRADSGSGTALDPFVIRDLEIIGQGYGGIIVMHTNVHFILRNIKVTGSGEPNSYDGIEFAGVTNGTIERCTFVNASANLGSLRNIRVIDNSFSGEGIIIGNIFVDGRADVSNITIAGNTLSNCSWDGISLNRCNNATVFSNQVNNCSYHAIGVAYSQNILITDNVLRDNGAGIEMWQDQGVSAVANQIEGSSGEGAVIEYSTEVSMHHNNFINNTVHFREEARREPVSISFGYPAGGNYYSNLSTPDLLSGPGQNLSGSDGILDEPFNATAHLIDEYPLAAPFTRSSAAETPFAHVVVLPRFGRLNKSFTLDASNTWDSKDPAFDMDYRWDWNNDGVWDTPYSSRMTVAYSYTGPGNSTVRMMARDSDGLTDETTCTLVVDRQAPVFTTDFAPGKVVFTKHQPIWINWTCEEDLSGLAMIENDPWSDRQFSVQINGHELGEIGGPDTGYMWMQGGGSFSVTSNLIIEGLPDGDYVVVIQAIDAAGNLAVLQIEFTIDTNPLSPSGPNGPWPLVAIIATMVAIVVAIAYLALKPRKGSPEASSVPGQVAVSRNGEGA
jgi:parallel beta-helix repeat protein